MKAINRLVDEKGYEYVETSDDWKKACLPLPCFSAVWWPDYATKVVEDTIDGKPVVIQLWKGWCQKFLGDDDFPGGIGAEVGIYHRVPGKVPPADLGFLPQRVAEFFLNGLAKLGGEHFWWPFPELNTRIDFELVNPKDDQTFLKAGPETTYWLNKWMNPESYEAYKDKEDAHTPVFSAHYKLKYRINGKSYEW